LHFVAKRGLRGGAYCNECKNHGLVCSVVIRIDFSEFLDLDPEGQKNHKKEINLCFEVLGVLF
jgi:hypothetical protein